MPIDVSPPMSGNLQGFQVAPVQSTDPLQTLSQMSQLRTQGLQQQQANLQLKQQQMQMDSNKAMMQAFVDGGGDYAKTDAAMRQNPSILPGDYLGFQKHALDIQTQRAANTEKENAIYDRDAQRYYSLVKDAKTQDDIDAANLRASQEGVSSKVPRLTTMPVDPAHVQSWANGSIMPATVADIQAKEAATKEAGAKTAESTAAAGEATTRNAIAQRTQAIAEIQGAADPATGMPALTDYTAIKQRYPQAGLPDVLTPGALKLLTRSTVAAKEQPEYDIKTAQADAMKAWRAGDPSQIDQMVDKIAPVSDPMNATTKQYLHGLVNSGGTMEQFQQGVKDLYDHRKTIATETNPDVQAAKIQVAKALAQNRQNITIAGYGQQLTGLPGGGLTGPEPIIHPGPMQQTPGGAGVPAAQQHGEAYLATLPPALAAQVKNIATGGDVLPARMTGPSAMLKNAVYQYDPAYTPLLAQHRKEVLKNLDDQSQAGGKITALNTMIHHGDLYQQTADALDNGTFVPGNAVWNAVKTAFGKAPPTNAGLVAQFFAGETAKVAGEQSQGEVNAILDKMKTAGSPEQMRQAGQTLLGIAAGRMIPYQEMSDDAKLQGIAKPILGPSEKAILQRRGFDPNTMQPVKQGGQQGGPPQYRQQMRNPQTGHTIGLGTDNKWHDVQTGAVIQ